MLEANVTLIVHCVPAASAAGQGLPLGVKVGALSVLTDVIASEPVPSLISVTLFVIPGAPARSVLPKSNGFGLKVTCGAVPVPVNGPVWGLAAASSGMVSVPVRIPVAAGVKMTVTWHVCPAGSPVPGQSVVAMNSELEVETMLTVTGKLPLFLSET